MKQLSNLTMIALALSPAGCALDAPGAGSTAQAIAAAPPACPAGADLAAFAACLRDVYFSRCEAGDLPDSIWCLGAQHMNDLSNEDLAAELGLACDPAPKPVPGACWSAAPAALGCPLDLPPLDHAACLRSAYAARRISNQLVLPTWDLGFQEIFDLTNEDIVAELGLLDLEPLPDQPGPAPAP